MRLYVVYQTLTIHFHVALLYGFLTVHHSVEKLGLSLQDSLQGKLVEGWKKGIQTHYSSASVLVE